MRARATVVDETALGDDVVGTRRHAEVRAGHPRSPQAASGTTIARASICSWRYRSGNRSGHAETARCRRSSPCHSSLLAKEGTERPALRKAASTTRSNWSETMFTSAPRRRQNARNAGKPGSMRTVRICSSSLLGRCAQQRNLSRHAFARGNLSALPSCFHLAPRRVGETFEQAVRGIVRSNGAVEVNQDMPVWNCFALRVLTVLIDVSNLWPLWPVEQVGSRGAPGVAIGRNPRLKVLTPSMDLPSLFRRALSAYPSRARWMVARCDPCLPADEAASGPGDLSLTDCPGLPSQRKCPVRIAKSIA